MKFNIKKGDTQTKPHYFVYEDNFVSSKEVDKSLSGLTMVLKNANGMEGRIPIYDKIPHINIKDFGFVLFEFSPAIEDAVIKFEIEWHYLNYAGVNFQVPNNH